MKKFKRKGIKIEDVDIFFSSKERNETNFGQRMRGYGTLGGARRRDSIGETLEILHSLKEEAISRESLELIKGKFDIYRNDNESSLRRIKQNERTALSRSKDYFLCLSKIREKIFPNLKEGPRASILVDFKNKEFLGKDVFGKEGGNRKVEEKAEKILQISTLRNEMEELKTSFHSSKNRALGSLHNHQKNIRFSLFRLEGLTDEYESKLEELSIREERNFHIEVMLKSKGERLKSLIKDLLKKEKRLKSLRGSIKKKMEEEKILRDVVGTEERHKRRIEDRKKEIKDLKVEVEKLYTDIERIKVDKIEAEKITEELKLNLSNLESNLMEVMKKFENEQQKTPPGSPLPNEEEEDEGENSSEPSSPSTSKENTPRTTPHHSDLVEETLKFIDQRKPPSPEKGDSGFEEISRDVEEFKSDFTSLFNSIDVVKKRMAFYSSDLNHSNSARVRGPKGHVAIIFTSVEGSHGLWDRDVQLMLACMKIHNKILRETLTECNGYEVKSEGDSFMTAFQTVDAAVKFALKCQIRLNEAHWPKKLSDFPTCETEYGQTGHAIFNGLRVSMGIHDGRPICERDPVTKRTDYFGPMVNKSARISGCAIGGAVALSQSSYKAIRHFVGTGTINNQEVQRLGTKVFLKVVGRKKLKGVTKSETIRWIFPDILKRRGVILFEKHQKKEKTKKEEDSNHRLDRVIDVLNERRMKLDRRRNKITSKIGFELKLKSLESSNAEKEELISYLRKKMKDLKYSYERAVELKQTKLENESSSTEKKLEEENNNATLIKKDVESVIEKYKRMQDMYSELKGSFTSVEDVFNSRLKDELKKFQGDLCQMKEKFMFQKNRNVFDRKIWEVQKKILKTKIRHCEDTGDKQHLLIEDLHSKVKSVDTQIKKRKKQMISERRKKIRYEKKKNLFLEMEKKIEQDLEDGKVVSLLRNTTIQMENSQENTRGQVVLFKSSSSTSKNHVRRRRDEEGGGGGEKKINWKDDMVVRNTDIFLPEKQRNRQNEMVDKDTAFLDDLSKEIGDVFENMISSKTPIKNRRRKRRGRKKLWKIQQQPSTTKKKRRLRSSRSAITYIIDDGENSFVDSARTNLTSTTIDELSVLNDNNNNNNNNNPSSRRSSNSNNSTITEYEKKRLEKKIRRMKKKYENLEKSSLWMSEKSMLYRVKKRIREVSNLLKDAPVNNLPNINNNNNNTNQQDSNNNNNNNNKQLFFTPDGKRPKSGRRRRIRKKKRRHFLGTTIKKKRKNRFGLFEECVVSSSERPHTSVEMIYNNNKKKEQEEDSEEEDSEEEDIFLPNVHEHPLTQKIFDKDWAGKRGKFLKNHGFWMKNEHDDDDDNENNNNNLIRRRRRRRKGLILENKRRKMKRRWKKYLEDHNDFFLRCRDEEFQEKVKKFKRWTELSRRKSSIINIENNNNIDFFKKMMDEKNNKNNLSFKTINFSI